MIIRPATKSDQPKIIRLISDIFTEYGERICLENADADLLDLDKHFFDKGGMFWVLAEHDEIYGTNAVVPSPESVTSDRPSCTLKRLYLRTELRGGGWASQLMQQVVDWAELRGFARIEFWSDTRFERGHRFYQKFGCVKTGKIRTMLDGYLPYHEFQFELELVQAQSAAKRASKS